MSSTTFCTRYGFPENPYAVLSKQDTAFPQSSYSRTSNAHTSEGTRQHKTSTFSLLVRIRVLYQSFFILNVKKMSLILSFIGLFYLSVWIMKLGRNKRLLNDTVNSMVNFYVISNRQLLGWILKCYCLRFVRVMVLRLIR